MSNSAPTISYTVYENNKIVLTGTAHYALLHLIEHALKSESSRYIEFAIDNSIYKRSYYRIDFTTEAADNRHRDFLIYERLVALKALAIQYAALKKEHDLKIVQQAELAEQRRVANERMAQKREAYELEKQKEFAEKMRIADENLKIIIEQDRILFENIVNTQKELLENYASNQKKESDRIDALEQSTIKHLINNPLDSVNALISEVGKSYKVQHQIAVNIMNNAEVALLILKSDNNLWNKSFNIMESLALKAMTESSVAELIGQTLSTDSPVVYTLTKLGYIKTLTP
jgi:arsenate reductase-like glutaredoxin family protein